MRLGAISYYADFIISLLVVAGLIGLASIHNTWVGSAKFTFAAVGGFVLWTLLEYAIHRFVYHHAPYFKDIHDAHHAEPNAHIGAPPVVGVLLILAIFFAPFAQANVALASGLTTGVLLGYLAYMLIHHASHEWTLRPTSWLYQAKRHHALHHHRPEACNFGIVTSFWDHVFGTAYVGTLRRRNARGLSA
jgi:sterol desaturase/sphingolipid hydroxylase (fatty acid hydroxylase superfamily)